MIEVLPIKLLTDEDAPIFGRLSVSLGKLFRAGFPVAGGIAVSSPSFKLKTTLLKTDFHSEEVIDQSLTILTKETKSIPVPETLATETGKHKEFLLNGKPVKGVKNLWLELLDLWLDQIKGRFWNKGFYQGITDNLEPKVVTFVKKMQASGMAYYDEFTDDVNVALKSGKSLHPHDLKKIVDLVTAANRKLFFSNEYEWVLDGEVKLSRILPYTPRLRVPETTYPEVSGSEDQPPEAKSAVLVFADLSDGFIAEKTIDGVFIASERIFDLNFPNKSFEQLVSRLVESAISFPKSPVLLKLADKSEGMGLLRGSLRLLHQKSLFDPLVEALDFARIKKRLNNIHIVIPFVRNRSELAKVKHALADKKFQRKPSLEIWMEAAVPENIVNLENYLSEGLDGVVFNLDELIAHLNGFDPDEENLAFYKNEVEGLMKFLEEAILLLHKSKLPFITYGNLTTHTEILDFMVEKGVYGVVVGRYEAHFARGLLQQVEKRMVLRKSTI